MKRAFDIVFSLTVLLLFLPVFLIVSLFVFLFLGRPVFFVQERPGKDCKSFNLIKFRSMTDKRDQHGALLPFEDRITPLGKLLRATSLDELPNLINVLKGELSLVGPRPLRTNYLQYFTKEQMKRQQVLPGITGWAQVNGRNLISWDEKFALDVWYVENRGFWLDMKIILLTIKKVFKREGVTPANSIVEIPFDIYIKTKAANYEGRSELSGEI